MENFEKKIAASIEESPAGDFLQSEEWRKFQEAVGRKTYHIESLGGGASKLKLWANIIEHKLPVVGKYFYIPRWPSARISNFQFPMSNEIPNLPAGRQGSKSEIQNFFNQIINLAEKENAGWIRIEPENNYILEIIRNVVEINENKLRIMKAPHDMQPREIFVIDITKSEEELLAGMKQKTRYNIKLSQKRGVSVKALTNNQQLTTNNYFEEFLKLVKITSQRDGITPHPESYYRKMFETIPGEILKLYVAEYQGKIIAANIVIHYGNTATYLHGASDNEHRNVMAPYLLQWQAILDAKSAGLTKYDFGGVKITNNQQPTTDNWQGITRFKTGFSLNAKPAIFPGSYDIIIDPQKHFLYRILQKARSLF